MPQERFCTILTLGQFKAHLFFTASLGKKRSTLKHSSLEQSGTEGLRDHQIYHLLLCYIKIAYNYSCAPSKWITITFVFIKPAYNYSDATSKRLTITLVIHQSNLHLLQYIKIAFKQVLWYTDSKSLARQGFLIFSVTQKCNSTFHTKDRIKMEKCAV